MAAKIKSAQRRFLRTKLAELQSHESRLNGLYVKCWWCLKWTKMDRLTLDHVLPKWRGGTNAQTNLVLACRRCNWQRNRDDQVQRGRLGGSFWTLPYDPMGEASKSCQKGTMELSGGVWVVPANECGVSG